MLNTEILSLENFWEWNWSAWCMKGQIKALR